MCGLLVYVTFTNSKCYIYSLIDGSCVDCIEVYIEKHCGLDLGINKARLVEVKNCLDKGINPYTKIRTLVIGGRDKGIVRPVKELTESERRNKFNSLIGSSKAIFDDGPSDEPIKVGNLCISCNDPIDAMTSIYGRIIVGHMTKVEDILDKETLLIKRVIIGFPVYKTGDCCKACTDKLYADTYIDKDGNIVRGILIMDRPVNKIKESYSKGHREVSHTVPEARGHRNRKDEDQARGKGVVKRHTQIFLDKGGTESEEEWVISKPRPIQEPVDPKAYGYFRIGRK